MTRRHKPGHTPRRGGRKRRDWGKGWVELRERASGTRHVARWLEDGQQRSRTFATEVDALDFLDARASERRRAVPEPGQAPTLDQVAADWLREGRHRWAGSTYHTHERRWTQHVGPVFGSRPVDAVTHLEISLWIDGLMREHTTATAHGVASVLRAVYGHAVRIGALPVSPFARMRMPRIERRPVRVWTVEEARAMLDATRDDPWWHGFYAVAMATGLRRGELLALRWEDVDLGGGVVTVRRTMTTDEAGRLVESATTKGRRARKVALGPGTVAALARVPRWGPHVFSRRDGDAYAVSQLGEVHHRWCRRAGVREVRIHDLRHMVATRLLEANVNERVVTEVLGHASTDLLMVYQHVRDDLVRAAAVVTDDALFPTQSPTDEDISPE